MEVNIFINIDLATVFMLEKSLSSSSSLQITSTEVKCMTRIMYVAITRRSPQDVGMIAQISAPPTWKYTSNALAVVWL